MYRMITNVFVLFITRYMTSPVVPTVLYILQTLNIPVKYKVIKKSTCNKIIT